MAARLTVARFFLGAAGITLIATSGLHALGYGPVSKLLAESSIPSAWAGGMQGLWVEFSTHLVVLAALLFVAALRSQPGVQLVALVCGLGLAVDTVILGVYVGFFVGSVMVGGASVLTLAGWAMSRAAAAG